VILALARQPGPFRDAAEGWSFSELDLLDWMEENHVQPGEDMSGFFGGDYGS
jgi:hypothetical protein